MNKQERQEAVNKIVDKYGRIDLSDLNLEGAYLNKTNLQEADLQGANLYKANLERANLERANLERANLNWANLERANLNWARFEKADFIGLTKAELTNIIGQNEDTYNMIKGEFE